VLSIKKSLIDDDAELADEFGAPLFAHSYPPFTNEQASGKPVGYRVQSRAETGHPFRRRRP
jgi:hypothetical protein